MSTISFSSLYYEDRIAKRYSFISLVYTALVIKLIKYLINNLLRFITKRIYSYYL